MSWFQRNFLFISGSGLCLFLAAAWFADLPQNHRFTNQAEPFFEGLGSYSRVISTKSEVTQKYFNQGLAFLYGFDHEAALASFESAAGYDSECPMALWGIAISLGPHINKMAIRPTREIRAATAISRARKLSASATPVERGLIEALAKRYSDPPRSDRGRLDVAYAQSMRELRHRFAADPDVASLTAEAIMDVHAYNLWLQDGKPRRETTELIGILRSVLAHDPSHPLALHLLIHAYEASPNPEEADGAADRLRTLAPRLQHLLHMSSHIDIRRGRWQEAIVANEKAVTAAKMQLALSRRCEAREFALMHSYHMIAFAAMMQGQGGRMDQAITAMLLCAQDSSLKTLSNATDGYFAMRYEALVRFGRWDAMLAEGPPAISLPLATGSWHYCKGVAYAANNDIRNALIEYKALVRTQQAAPERADFRGAPAGRLLRIMERMLHGEIRYRQGFVDDAIVGLWEAVRQEDAFSFTEPPNWLLPARHALGATLVGASRFAEAEGVYSEDLKRYPDNVWSLVGLEYSLRMQRKYEQAAIVSLCVDRVSRGADLKVTSSCLCVRPARERFVGSASGATK
jgi:tetratricopeptide (TPR) repeat protein